MAISGGELGVALGDKLHRNFESSINTSMDQLRASEDSARQERLLRMKEDLSPYEKQRMMLENLIAQQQYQGLATENNWKRDLRNALARGV